MSWLSAIPPDAQSVRHSYESGDLKRRGGRLNCPSWRQRVMPLGSWASTPCAPMASLGRVLVAHDATLFCVTLGSCFKKCKRPVVSLPEASVLASCTDLSRQNLAFLVVCVTFSKMLEHLLGSGAPNILKGLESRVCVPLKAVLLNTLCARENAASTKFPLTETERLSTSTWEDGVWSSRDMWPRERATEAGVGRQA